MFGSDFDVHYELPYVAASRRASISKKTINRFVIPVASLLPRFSRPSGALDNHYSRVA